MKRLTIYDRRFSKNEHQVLEICLNDKGDLIFEGCDMGDSVKEYWGDFDYEYWLTIKSEHLSTVLLHLIKECFDNGIFKNDSAFREWLEKMGVPSEFQSYI